MNIQLTRRVRRLIIGMMVPFAVVACTGAMWIYRLPDVRRGCRSNAKELAGKRWTFPGEPGFWVARPVETHGVGIEGATSHITWMARQGLMPVQCEQDVIFDDAWGNRLSTIEGNNWNVDRGLFVMVGRMYDHFKRVSKGTPGSILDGDQTVILDAVQCAGDFHRYRRS